MDAQTIADALHSTLKPWGANLAFLIDQGYDGASAMSSSKNRMQAKIAKVFPNATYVHCRSHVLNLAISSGCTSVPSICNLFYSGSCLDMVFNGYSAKRKEIFLEIASCNNSKDQQLLDFSKIGDEDDEFDESMVAIESGSKRHHIPKLCATRWSARVSTLLDLC